MKASFLALLAFAAVSNALTCTTSKANVCSRTCKKNNAPAVTCYGAKGSVIVNDDYSQACYVIDNQGNTWMWVYASQAWVAWPDVRGCNGGNPCSFASAC
ncbi:hypothetical protein BKA70DRAFT_1302085 [Coprinopsis sp. MPI-PUGE-AT-0042]|nr:hypothetical protein BKA70DRAFT_1302085 [Coprinopsis sp. MPI-PUGE-AT-0042]